MVEFHQPPPGSISPAIKSSIVTPARADAGTFHYQARLPRVGSSARPIRRLQRKNFDIGVGLFWGRPLSGPWSVTLIKIQANVTSFSVPLSKGICGRG